MKTDVVIIGGGLAGLYVALQIKNKRVVVLTKADYNETNTYLAQGGIAAEMTTDKELLKEHVQDTLKAGAWHNDTEATELLVTEARDNILNLIEFGVQFDKDSSGEINMTLEGGHSSRRILHAGGDATGKVMMKALKSAVAKKENVTVIPDTMATDLIMKDNQCIGVQFLCKDETLETIFSSSTVVATGGVGGVYALSTNPKYASGDGVGLVYRAGGELRDMEFIQFHPTAFYESGVLNQAFLISEAVRGEGAHLVNSNGQRFMHKYDERLELAPRDTVSQSIIQEMYNTWSECVYLDARHLGREKLLNRFPTIYKNLTNKGLDMATDLIPVRPVQHYAIGGIKTNLKGETSIKNLYANGECSSTGVHGANRLASNSLLECVVFGNEIAKAIDDSTSDIQETVVPKQDWSNKNITYKPTIREIQNLMQKYVGVVRKTDELKLAKNIIKKHVDNLSKYTNYTKNYFRVLNTATTALLIVEGAIDRKKSIGCHYVIRG